MSEGLSPEDKKRLDPTSVEKELASEGNATPAPDAPPAEDIQTVVFQFPTDHEGNVLYVKGWIRPKTEFRPIVLVHGLGECALFYRDAAKQLYDRGFSVYAFDMRGHGRSGKIPGHVATFDQLVNDLLQLVNWVRHKSNRSVPFIVGSGIGALIAVYFQRTYPKYCSSLVLVSPHLNKVGMSWGKRFMMRMLAELTPTMQLVGSLTPRGVSPQFLLKKISNKALDIKMGLPGISANFAAQLIVALEQGIAMLSDVTCPTLIYCAKEDDSTNYSKVLEMIGRHPRKNMFAIREIDGEAHQLLLQEPSKLEPIVDSMASWLEVEDRRLNELKQISRQAAVSADPEEP